jgi:hypothetical protein
MSAAILQRDIRSADLSFLNSKNHVSSAEGHALVDIVTKHLSAVPCWLQGKNIVAACGGINSMITLCGKVLQSTANKEVWHTEIQQVVNVPMF